MREAKERNKSIDVLRGLAIILVVVGHAIQSHYVDFDTNLIFRFVYASHMPLFMFVSGYAAGYSSSARGFSLYKKFLTLIVPFVSWYTLSYFINQSWNSVELRAYITRVIVSPDWGLWFLPILFLCYLLLWLGKKLESCFGVTVYLAIWILLQLIPPIGFGIDLLRWHFAFFVAGYLANQRYKLDSLVIPFAGSLMIGLFYTVSVLLWRRTMTSVDLRMLSFLPIPGHDLTHPLMVSLYKYLVALLGIAFWWAVAASLKNFRLKNYLGYLGLFTLDIYVCHLYFFKFSLGSGPIKLVSSVILGLTLPLVLSYLLLRRFSLFNKFFLGDRPLSDFKKLRQNSY